MNMSKKKIGEGRRIYFWPRIKELKEKGYLETSSDDSFLNELFDAVRKEIPKACRVKISPTYQVIFISGTGIEISLIHKCKEIKKRHEKCLKLLNEAIKKIKKKSKIYAQG